MKQHAQHTPGLWKHNGFGDTPEEMAVAVWAGDVPVASAFDVGRYGRPDPDETQANMFLIAAAPELLAALVRASDHLIMSGTRCDDAPEALAQARAAIAKAKGKA